VEQFVGSPLIEHKNWGVAPLKGSRLGGGPQRDHEMGEILIFAVSPGGTDRGKKRVSGVVKGIADEAGAVTEGERKGDPSMRTPPHAGCVQGNCRSVNKKKKSDGRGGVKGPRMMTAKRERGSSARNGCTKGTERRRAKTVSRDQEERGMIL